MLACINMFFHALTYLHALTCSNIMNVIPNLYHVVLDKCTFIFTLQNFIPRKYFGPKYIVQCTSFVFYRTNDFAFVNHILILSL